MIREKLLIFEREIIREVAIFSSLLTIAIVAPLFHFQPITGTIVNATLFLATSLLGSSAAMLIGLIPSVVALSVGLLPPVLAPMIPFIMISNTILVLVFGFFKNKSYWIGVLIASFLKFLFLFSTSSIVINLLLKKDIALKVAQMMSWPQFLTALGGGVIAYLVLHSLFFLKKAYNKAQKNSS